MVFLLTFCEKFQWFHTQQIQDYTVDLQEVKRVPRLFCKVLWGLSFMGAFQIFFSGI